MFFEPRSFENDLYALYAFPLWLNSDNTQGFLTAEVHRGKAKRAQSSYYYSEFVFI